MRYLSLLLLFSIQVVSQNEDGGRSSALHEVLQREKQLSNQLDQAKVRCSQSISVTAQVIMCDCSDICNTLVLYAAVSDTAGVFGWQSRCIGS